MSRVLNISFKYNFLETLASFWLNKHCNSSNFQNSTIILPNIRSTLILKKIFIEKLVNNKDNNSFLLPNILSIDKFSTNDSLFHSAQVKNKNPAPQSFRLMHLARLISAFIEKKNLFDKLDQSKIFQLAASLGDVLDKIIIDQIDILDFQKHVKSIDNKHFKVSLQFLEEVIFKYWPKIALEAGFIENNQLTNIAINNLIKKILSKSFLDDEFILAGTRGRRISTQRLMQAIYKHSNGIVILNGFHYKKNCQITSPLFLQNRFVTKNNIQKIEEIANTDNIVSSDDRINAYLSCFENEFDLSSSKPINAGCTNNTDLKKNDCGKSGAKKRPQQTQQNSQKKVKLNLAECSTSLEEAKLVATLTKNLLLEKKSVLIISQTKELSESIINFLNTLNINYHYSQGISYSKCPVGRILLKIAKVYSFLMSDKIKNTDYLALVSDPLSIFAKNRNFVNYYDKSLRAKSDFDNLKNHHSSEVFSDLAYNNKNKNILADNNLKLLHDFNQILKQIENKVISNQTKSLSEHLKIIHFFLSKLIDGKEVQKQSLDYNTINNFILELIENGQSNDLVREESFSVLSIIMDGNSLQPNYDISACVQILTNFEARFVATDAVIITSFEDGIWPERVDAGPWLPTRIQNKIGFEDFDLSSGQTAHNLLQYLNQKETFITFAKVKNSKANLHSKWWLQLLQNDLFYIDDMSDYLLDVNQFFGVLPWNNFLEVKKPIVISKITPKQKYSFSPTSLTTLINSPLDYHIQYNLKLKEMPPYALQTKNLLIGNIIHKVMEEFFSSDLSLCVNNKKISRSKIANELIKSFSEKFVDDSSILINNHFKQSFIKIANNIIVNNHLKALNYNEIDGVWQTYIDKYQVVFNARADRISYDKKNTINIIDYKTGKIQKITKLQAILELTLWQKKAFKINHDYDNLYFSFWEIDNKGNFKDSRVVLDDKTDLIIKKLEEIIEYILSNSSFYHVTNKTHHKIITRYHDWK